MKPSHIQLNVTTAAEEMGLPVPQLNRLLVDLDCFPDPQGNFTALDLLRGAYRVCPGAAESVGIVRASLKQAAEKAFGPSSQP